MKEEYKKLPLRSGVGIICGFECGQGVCVPAGSGQDEAYRCEVVLDSGGSEGRESNS